MSTTKPGRIGAAAARTSERPEDLPAYKCGRYGHMSKRNRKLCRQNVVAGTEHCPHHAGKPLEQHKAEGQIRLVAAELAADPTSKWTLDGHDGSDLDPKVVILQMIAFWRWKTSQYGALLQKEYEAAEALGIKVNGEQIISLNDPEWESDGGDDVLPEHPALQRARHAVEQTFTRGGTAAFIGHEYDVDRNSRVFAVKEGIRALVTLEERAHTMLAKCCHLAVQAKVAESRIQLAEQVGVMIQAVILGVLRDLSIAADDRVMQIIAVNIDQVAGTPALAA